MNKKDLENLVRSVRLPADVAAIEAINEGETQARIVEAALSAAFECAFGNGLINEVAQDQQPLMITNGPPYPFPLDED